MSKNPRQGKAIILIQERESDGLGEGGPSGGLKKCSDSKCFLTVVLMEPADEFDVELGWVEEIERNQE